MIPKAERQKVLLTIVRNHRPANQHEIVALMRRSGWKVTQASVSRDVHELGVVKANGHYAVLNDLPAGPASAAAAEQAQRMRGLITGASAVGSHLLVVRTVVGAASTVAAAVDDQHLREAVGTLAGDDTIFVAVRSRTAQTRVLNVLRSWMR
ncbi:MAG: arginine repressor [Planctomycetia bacterium]|nr:MAG: arginine repressor [Planctomycetia bacterium]